MQDPEQDHPGRPVRRRMSLGAAAMLPATLLAAVLVAAPFAGTTTHALAAGRPAAATSRAAATPATGSGAAAASSSTAHPATSGSAAHAAGVSAFSVHFHVVIPRPAVRILVVAYALIAFLAAAVIVLAAIRPWRRTRGDGPPGSRPGARLPGLR